MWKYGGGVWMGHGGGVEVWRLCGSRGVDGVGAVEQKAPTCCCSIALLDAPRRPTKRAEPSTFCAAAVVGETSAGEQN